MVKTGGSLLPRVAAVVSVVVVGCPLGAFASVAAGTMSKSAPFTSRSHPAAAPLNVVTAAPYPVNENGMTYGSNIGASLDDGPELIIAYGTHGEIGDIKESDVYQPAPTSDADAIKLNEQGARTVPLYAQDGVTIVGQFTIERPVVKVDPTETPSSH